MGRRIREYHKQIRGVRPDGVRYHALEPEAYAWVHATLAAGIVAAHERFGLRLSEADREQLWARVAHARAPARDPDARPSVRPGGSSAPISTGPSSTPSCAPRPSRKCSTRSPSPAPPELSRAYRPLWAVTSRPLGHVIVALATAGLLPATLRERFGIPWGRGRELELRALAGPSGPPPP